MIYHQKVTMRTENVRIILYPCRLHSYLPLYFIIVLPT